MFGLQISDAVKDLIINIINIIVLFVIVKSLAYKPVKKFLDARKARIDESLKNAESKNARKFGDMINQFRYVIHGIPRKNKDVF